MADINVQASFNAGEWSPTLFARVDLQKWRSGAALLENFFVDYRGGASSRPGTRYIIQCRDSAHPVRLIPFQSSFNAGYILEFGQNYIRFIFEGQPVVNTPLSITGATQANPCVLTVPGNTYATGDWIFVQNVGGMTQLNGRYYKITNVAGPLVTIATLDGTPVNSIGYSAFTSGGTAASVYTISSPYAASDLALVKYTQTQNVMILCHPNYVPYSLSLISATNWALQPITFGTTAGTPTGVHVDSTLPAWNALINQPYGWPGQSYYSYVVTSVDSNGQESNASQPGNIGPRVDIRNYPGGGTNAISANPVTGAVGYNFYEGAISYFGVQPAGIQYGFIGTSTTPTFIDDNIGPDFSETPPVAKNPFTGKGISFVTITASGTYTSVPIVSFVGGSPAIAASAVAQLGLISTPTIGSGGTNYLVGDTANFGNGVVVIVTTIGSGGVVTGISVGSSGSITSGSVPTNPVSQVNSSSAGTGLTLNLTWGVVGVVMQSQGAGYTSTPTVAFSFGGAAATATLSPTGNGNPSVPSFFQQRLVLAGAPGAPQTFHMSVPGNYYNFDVHNPIQATDAISGTLVSGTQNNIKSIVSVPSGMLILTDKAAWVVNGGFVSQGVAAAVSPSNIVAAAQSWTGASDVPPLLINWDVLFVQSKGYEVRDITYNIYFNVFTSADITILSSQLFYGFFVKEWAWSEQPFFNVWTVRNDGVMLTLTYLKEQEFTAWTHHITTGGLFKSVASITEATSIAGNVDATYTVVQRSINSQTVQYIERFAERIYPNGLASAWTVDCALQYNGPPILAFQGTEQLAGQVVTGLATDNLGNTTVITPFTMPVSGFFTLPAPGGGATGYTVVTIGLGFICKLQTLPLDIGQGATVQAKPKKIPYVDVRVNQTLGLTIGSTFSSLVPMKDLIQGNVSSMLTGQPIQIVNGLYSGDARTFLDPTYTIPGQYCLEQPLPYPASILGLFPSIVIGDTD